MKLFVWNNPYAVSYGASCLYAIAETEDEARQAAINAAVSECGDTPKNHCVIDVSGSPDRVHELPYAEVYEWQE